MTELTDKKKAIFDSTLALVREHGFHGTPMSQIAKKAGVAVGAIYHHFASKDDLILELAEYVKEQMLQSLLQTDNDDMEYRERFFNFFISHCLFYIQHPEALFFMEQFVNSPYSSRSPIQENEKVQGSFRHLIINGIDTKILKPLDYRIVGSLVHGSVTTTAKIHLCRKVPISETVLRQIAQVVWDGLVLVPAP